VQYAHARICSILRQPEAAAFLNQSSTITKLLPQERALIMYLLRFPEEIELICKNFSIQRLTTYAETLAQKFHVFYHDCRVLSEDQNLSILRLFLCQKVREVLAEVLRLLGVSAPEKM
jgi:arginyl-tRNA synthetase